MAGRPTTLDEMLEHENHELPQFDADAIASLVISILGHMTIEQRGVVMREHMARQRKLLEDWRREAREEAEDTFG